MKTILKPICIWLVSALGPVLAIFAFVARSTSLDSAYNNLHGLLALAAGWGFLGSVFFLIVKRLCFHVIKDAKLSALIGGAVAGTAAIKLLGLNRRHQATGSKLGSAVLCRSDRDHLWNHPRRRLGGNLHLRSLRI
jgi:hypothetical protein